MMRRRVGRPGLIGTMARTAVVAGTASATVGAMSSHKQKKAQAAADQQASQQAAVESQQELAEMKTQLDEMKAQQAAAAPPPPPPPAPAGTEDLMDQLGKLADLKAAGVLDDAEFAAAKAKLLGT
jgi:type IV secretory pathway VirB10-like protein